MALRIVMLLACASVLATACGSTPPHSVAGKDYARSCVDVIDCVPIYEGPIGCCGGGCPNAAIRADALAKYTADFNQRTPTCSPPPPCAPPQPCAGGRVACTNGLCELLVGNGAAPDDGG